jgi:hypothetical protein
MSVVNRRKKLMGWFGMACRCGKCVKEAATATDAGYSGHICTQLSKVPWALQ